MGIIILAIISAMLIGFGEDFNSIGLSFGGFVGLMCCFIVPIVKHTIKKDK